MIHWPQLASRSRLRNRQSLDFDFVSSPSLTGNRGGTITLTRATTATYVGSNGLIQTASANAPRFDYDPVTLLCKGFLVEAAATNLAIQSGDLNTSWIKGNSTINATRVTGPDGALSAQKLQEDATAAVEHTVYITVAASLAAYTASVYAKAGERSWLYLRNTDSTGKGVWFNLAAGTIGTQDAGRTGRITAAGNGFYRCEVTATAAAGTYYMAMNTAPSDGVSVYDGVAGNGIYLYGMQFEIGSVATSYIPTTTTSVTRNADVATIATGSWYNALAGTLYAEFLNPTVMSAAGNTACTLGSVGNNIMTLYPFTVTTAVWQVNVAAVNTVLISAVALTGGATAKMAGVYQLNDFAAFANNTALGVDTVSAVPAVTTFYLGCDVNSTGQLNSTIRAIRYYPYRLPNEIAKQLTA